MCLAVLCSEGKALILSVIFLTCFGERARERGGQGHFLPRMDSQKAESFAQWSESRVIDLLSCSFLFFSFFH